MQMFFDQILNLSGKKSTYTTIRECQIKSSHFKVHPLIDPGSDLRICRIKILFFRSVCVDEVGRDRPTL